MLLVYLSRMICGPAAIADILATARDRNVRSGLTGLLLHDRRHFMQFLEGPEAPLSDTLLRIAADPRHVDLTVLACETAPARLFTSWPMAIRPYDDRRGTLAAQATALAPLARPDRLLRLQEFGLAQCP